MTSKDFSQRSQVTTLRRNGSQAEPDEIAEAMRLRRKILAEKMLDQSVNSVSAEAVRAENDVLKARIERQQLDSQVKDAGQAGSAWQEFLMAQLKDVQDRLAESERAHNEQQMSAFQDRVNMLSEELGRVRADAGQPPPDPMAQTVETIKRMQELNDLLRPPSKEPPVPQTEDAAAITLWAKKLDVEIEQMRMDREDRQADREERRQQWEAERQDRKELEAARLAQEKEAKDIQIRVLTETIPKIGQTVSDLLAKVTDMQRAGVAAQGVASPPAAVEAAARPEARPDPPVPTGAEKVRCGVCGLVLIVRPEWPGVICPHCGTEWKTQPELPKDADTGAGRDAGLPMGVNYPDSEFSTEGEAAVS